METRRRASVSPQHFTAAASVDRTAIIAASKQAAPRILTGPVVVAAAEPASVIAASAADHCMNQGGTRSRGRLLRVKYFHRVQDGRSLVAKMRFPI